MAEKLTFFQSFIPALYEFIWVGVFGLIIGGISTLFLLLYNSNSRWTQYALGGSVMLGIVAAIWVIFALRYRQRFLAGQAEPNPFDTPEFDLIPKIGATEKPDEDNKRQDIVTDAAFTPNHNIKYMSVANADIGWLTYFDDKFYKSQKWTKLSPLIVTFENTGEGIDNVQAQISYFTDLLGKPIEMIGSRVNPAFWLTDVVTDKVFFPINKSNNLILGVLERSGKGESKKELFTMYESVDGKPIKKSVLKIQTLFIRVRLFSVNTPIGEYKFEFSHPPFDFIHLAPKEFETD